MKTTAILLVGICELLLIVPAASAEFTTGLINMDFNFTAQSFTQAGPALLGTNGDFWNSISAPNGPPTSTLLLASGIPSNGVTLVVSGSDGGIVGTGAQFSPTPFFPLMSDGYGVLPDHTMGLTLNGLSPTHLYELFLYSAEGGNDGRITTFTVNGISRSARNLGSPSVFVEGNNYVHFTNVAADASGQMLIAVQGTGGTGQFVSPGGFVNGFQIVAVPEPSSYALAACAALYLIPHALRCWTAKGR